MAQAGERQDAPMGPKAIHSTVLTTEEGITMTCAIAPIVRSITIKRMKYMGKWLSVATSAVAIGFCSPAMAGQGVGGKIGSIVPVVGGAFTFAYTGTHISPPGCATTVANWAIDVSTPSGQAAASAIMTAFSLNSYVNIRGTGACLAAEPDEESVVYVEVVR
jgi:hypothetical protein